MRFWDASALVPLYIAQPASPRLLDLLKEDGQILAWWGSPIECVSALCRLNREGRLDAAALQTALENLHTDAEGWDVVAPSEEVRNLSGRSLRVHPLRAADALQLAAALVACARRPEELPMVCLDERLAAAARKEGFRVVK